MKLREVRIQNFRNFGPTLRTVSFVDELTEQVRPLSILVGSNGSGKTTILEAIEGLLRFAIDKSSAGAFGDNLREEGFADMRLEFGEEAPGDLRGGLSVALGRKDRTTVDYKDADYDICALVQRGAPGNPWLRDTHRLELEQWLSAMRLGREPLAGGLMHFPHRRWIEHEQKGAIEEPARGTSWIFRFDPSGAWEGSLSQFWVWQNYRDLEQGREGRPNLAPFVEAIEAVLGQGRRVVIRDARVHILLPGGAMCGLHQLPSGEQQVLTLFGEIIRRLRPGGILMIDEVEISLHPALQRVVLAHLRKLAQKFDLQVILTTHSMDIIAAVAPAEIINLDDMVLRERARVQEPQA